MLILCVLKISCGIYMLVCVLLLFLYCVVLICGLFVDSFCAVFVYLQFLVCLFHGAGTGVGTLCHCSTVSRYNET
jgi:hypothetical protein